jgi:hypothetical protein
MNWPDTQRYMHTLQTLVLECNREVDRLMGVRDDDGELFTDALAQVMEVRLELGRG